MRVSRPRVIHVRSSFSIAAIVLCWVCGVAKYVWGVRYTYAVIAKAMRALQSSLKTSMRIDDEGLLSLQFLMPGPRRPGRERSQAFVEFWVSVWSARSRRAWGSLLT